MEDGGVSVGGGGFCLVVVDRAVPRVGDTALSRPVVVHVSATACVIPKPSAVRRFFLLSLLLD